MNRKVMMSSLAALSLNGAGPLFANTDESYAEATIEALEQQWTQAQNANDSALESTFVGDKVIFVGLDGKVLNKDQFVAEEKATKYTQVAIDDVVVHAYPGTAVTTYTMTLKGTGPNGKPLNVRERVTDTWVRMPDGKYRCVASVGSPLKV
jgi:ketosteroid isomerase-like protein